MLINKKRILFINSYVCSIHCVLTFLYINKLLQNIVCYKIIQNKSKLSFSQCFNNLYNLIKKEQLKEKLKKCCLQATIICLKP